MMVWFKFHQKWFVNQLNSPSASKHIELIFIRKVCLGNTLLERDIFITLILNDPLVKRHMPLSVDDFNEQQYQEFITTKEAIWKAWGFGPWAYFVNNEFVGWGGIQPDEGDFELALVLFPAYWGYGRVLYYELIREAFIELNLDSVTILFPPSRTRINWILRAGFVEEAQVSIDGKKFIRFRLKNPQVRY